MPRLFTGYIDENTCMGDTLGQTFGGSPGTINENSYKLDLATQSLSAENISLKNKYNTLIQTLTGFAAIGTNYTSLSTSFQSLQSLIIP